MRNEQKHVSADYRRLQCDRNCLIDALLLTVKAVETVNAFKHLNMSRVLMTRNAPPQQWEFPCGCRSDIHTRVALFRQYEEINTSAALRVQWDRRQQTH